MTTTAPHPTQNALSDEQRPHVDALFALLNGSDTLDVRVADVVRETGSCNAAFYRAFGSKDELLLVAATENARRNAEIIWGKVTDASTPAEIVSLWVSHVLKMASNPKLARASQAFALDRYRLAHRYPERMAESQDLLNAPLDYALELAQVPDRDLVQDAISHLVLALQTSYISAGEHPRPRRTRAIVQLCLRMAAIEPTGPAAS